MTLAPLAASPAAASAAYGRSLSVGEVGSEGGGFGSALSRAIEGYVSAGRTADTAALNAVGGTGSVTEVVTAVSRAELALQGAVAVRDKVVQAYQEIMRMPI